MPPDDLERVEARARAEAHLAQGLRHLRESEDWQVLRQAMLNGKRKVMDGWTKALFRGEPVNQRQIDYDRGYWDGVAQVLEQPFAAMKQLEGTLERLEKLSRRTQD